MRSPASSIRTLTVGFGLSPNQPCRRANAGRVADCRFAHGPDAERPRALCPRPVHRQWGIPPRPETAKPMLALVCLPVKCFIQLKRLLIGCRRIDWKPHLVYPNLQYAKDAHCLPLGLLPPKGICMCQTPRPFGTYKCRTVPSQITLATFLANSQTHAGQNHR